MEKKLWFRAKRYGWGWYPITWQGWAVIALYVISLLHIAFDMPKFPSTLDLIGDLILPITGLTMILISVCYKTGEKPHWRWGGK